MTPEQLIEHFRQYEAKGFYLHADMAHTRATVESLLDNKNRYGHLSCPCRLATGNFADDEDIVCPCAYCEDDLKEFGACYCILFVSEAFKDDDQFYPDIDDRRPPEKVK